MAPDPLYDADRRTILAELVVAAIREFCIRMDEFHNDSTTVIFSDRYLDAGSGYRRGKKSMVETPTPSSEGFHIVWVWSLQKEWKWKRRLNSYQKRPIAAIE